MNYIFVITASGGSYDDAWENNLFAVTGEERAKAEVERLQLVHRDCKEVWPDIRQVLNEEMKKVRSCKFEQVPPMPKGPTKQTKEARAAFKAAMGEWRKIAEPIGQRNLTMQNQLMAEAIRATYEEAQKMGLDEEHLKQLGFYNHNGELTYPNFEQDVHYGYEQLELRS